MNKSYVGCILVSFCPVGASIAAVRFSKVFEGLALTILDHLAPKLYIFRILTILKLDRILPIGCSRQALRNTEQFQQL